MHRRLREPIAFLILLLFTCGCHKELPVTAPATARLGRVSAAAATVETRYSFSLLPYRQADLGFKSGGIVDQIAEVRGADGKMREITMGDPAPTGLRLARVRTLDYQHQLDTAKANLAQARASLASAKASQQLADINFERASNLYQEASLTKQNYDQAQQQKETADAAVRQAQAAIAASQTSIDQATLALHDTAVDSPFNGVVVSRQVELGNIIASGATAFQVADIHQLKADFTVPDTLLRYVPKGRRFALNLPGEMGPVVATVTAVSPAGDPSSHLFTVEIMLPNATGYFKPGMIGALELAQDKNSGDHVLTVPLGSLVHTNSGTGFAVYVPRRDNGHIFAKLQPVEIGRGIGQDVEIRGGLSPSQEIVTVGAQMLHDNDEIRVVE